MFIMMLLFRNKQYMLLVTRASCRGIAENYYSVVVVFIVVLVVVVNK
jgi:hypothetical protein